MFKHLPVPLDGSTHAEFALPVAVRIAHVCTSHLLLLSCQSARCGLADLGTRTQRALPA